MPRIPGEEGMSCWFEIDTETQFPYRQFFFLFCPEISFRVWEKRVLSANLSLWVGNTIGNISLAVYFFLISVDRVGKHVRKTMIQHLNRVFCFIFMMSVYCRLSACAPTSDQRQPISYKLVCSSRSCAILSHQVSRPCVSVRETTALLLFLWICFEAELWKRKDQEWKRSKVQVRERRVRQDICSDWYGIFTPKSDAGDVDAGTLFLSQWIGLFL